MDDEAMGITPARAAALSVLVFGGARSLTELATAEGVTPATMSKLVTALEGEGFARRYPDVNDARSIRIEATAKARRILERGRSRRLDLLEGLLAEATSAEIDAVGTAAEVLERALESA
ncbi:MAG TPA: MarR family transcriptional regulator [Gaiellaceae bacterium]|nr:MarR family transcriptional regulator [Gaiellaceae bacterium]